MAVSDVGPSVNRERELPEIPSLQWAYEFSTGVTVLGLIGLAAVIHRAAYVFGQAESKFPM